MPQYNWKKILIITLSIASIVVYLFSLYKNANSPSMPLASPPALNQKTQDEVAAIKKFSWENIMLPEVQSELFLYQTTTSLASPGKLEDLVSLLGFTDSDISIATAKQTTWSKEGGVLAISSSPQYIQYTAPNTEGTPIGFKNLESILRNNNLTMNAPTTSAESVYSLETGIKTIFTAKTHPISQTIDKYPVYSQSFSNLGTIIINEENGGLVSITISGGYAQITKSGSVTPLSLEDLKNIAEKNAIEIYVTENISDTKTLLNQAQRVVVGGVKIIYYSDPNSTSIVPGYLVTGTNQSGKTLNYFIPML